MSLVKERDNKDRETVCGASLSWQTIVFRKESDKKRHRDSVKERDDKDRETQGLLFSHLNACDGYSRFVARFQMWRLHAPSAVLPRPRPCSLFRSLNPTGSAHAAIGSCERW